MTITNIAQGQKDRERVNISVDGEYSFAVEKDTLVKFSLYNGMNLTTVQIDEIKVADSIQFLTRRLSMWCYRKPRSEKEMRQKITELLRKRFPDGFAEEPEVADQVMQRMRSKQCDDQHFAEWFVQERQRQGKYGRRKVMSELILKNVDRELAQTALDEFFPDDIELAKMFLGQRFGVESLGEIADQAERSRAYRQLQSHGFPILN